MGGRRPKVAALAMALAAVVPLAACSSDGGGSDDAFCEQVAKVPSLAAALSNFTDRDADALAARLDDARTSYEALADAAPSAIRSDTRTVVDLIDVVIEAVDAHPDDNEAAAAQLREAVEDHAEAGEAAQRVRAYAKATCGIDLDPSAAPAGEATTSTAPTPTTEAEGG